MNVAPRYFRLRQTAHHLCQSHRLLRKGVKVLRIPANIGPKKPFSLERAVLGARTNKGNSGAIERLFCFCEMNCRNFSNAERLLRSTRHRKTAAVKRDRRLS